MSIFEEILVAALTAGKVIGPVFIHSAHGTAILNASEDGLAAILEAHQQAQAADSPAPAK